MLTAREQLMEDIDSIVDEIFKSCIQMLNRKLCDAVCKNFPTSL